MKQLLRAVVFVSLGLYSVAAFAASADFSGVWDGTISGTNTCRDGRVIPFVYGTTANFAQKDDQVSGSLAITAENDPCIANSPSKTELLPINGLASGSTLIVAIVNGSENLQVRIDVSGDAMQIVVSGENGQDKFTFGGSLKRTSGGQTRTPAIAIGSFPAGILQVAGEGGGSDSFTVANLGLAVANVTLTQTGNFFTIAPAGFTVDPGATQTVAITALNQPPATYAGSVTVTSGAQALSVPVRLLVAGRPTAPVDPQPSAPRFEVSAPAGQNPPASIATFTNAGTGVVQALVVVDVPWIILPSTVLTIQPGQSQDVTFNIDRAKRDDGGAAGGASGTLTLRFLSAASGIRALGGSSSTATSSSTQVVDVVKASISSGTPPALQTGETAFYLPGCGTAGTTLCDAFLSSRAALAVSDLRLVLPGTRQIALLPSLSTNIPLTFPSLTRTVFGLDGAATVQVRSSQAASLSLAALRINSIGALAYATALPVFRSDRGIQSGERLVLSGLEQSGTSSSSIIVQELSGTSATAELQAYNASGAPLGTPIAIALTAFGQGSDGGAATIAGAAAVVVRNTSSGSGRINAVGRVQDSATNDSWVVLDPAMIARGAGTLIMPLPVNIASADTRLYVTNTSAAPVDFRAETVATVSRRRAATHALTETPNAIVGSLQTVQPAVGGTTGYVRLTAPDGSISASGRVVLRGTTGALFGGALPVIPSSAALGAGDTKRFTAVDDASAATVAAGVPSTFRTSLLMIETSGQKTTVLVTLRFILAGTLATARPAPSRTFTVDAGKMLVISDIASSIIGPSRASFGNLRNMQLDLQVSSGGRLLSFVQTIDNGTGDVTMRTD
jgi:hypothetical protein